ncbi:hypothetical protein [Hyphobacterium sp.]|uniref:hypothetical protein n=1 Tax=Hyphobacterium sp. TaxID=2004662 RepID=UPI003BABA413
MKQLFIVCSVIAIAACSATGGSTGAESSNPEPVRTPDGVDGADCSEPSIKAFEGLHISDVNLDALPDRYRIIRPGMSVTMDYVEERGNLELDVNDVVVRGYCG